MNTTIPSEKDDKADAERATHTIPFDPADGTKPRTEGIPAENQIDPDPENAPAPTSDDPRDRNPPERTLR